MIDSPVVAREYYPRLAERVAVHHLFRFLTLLLTRFDIRIPVSLSVNA